MAPSPLDTPEIALSTYTLVAASLSTVGALKLVIFYAFKSTAATAYVILSKVTVLSYLASNPASNYPLFTASEAKDPSAKEVIYYEFKSTAATGALTASKVTEASYLAPRAPST